MTKGCVYYTDFHCDPKILQICREQLRKSFDGEIVCVSLGKQLDFGKNIVLENRIRGYATMVEQILMALENSTADIVFFTEADVLYPKCHFEFTPPRNDIYYYNQNIWRWDYPKDRLITYKGLGSLSGMCANRELALNHYKGRHKKIIENGWDKLTSKEPSFGRKWGYEPGTKKRKRGGFSDEDFDIWFSNTPIIDIRHGGTYTRTKVTLDSFKHPPDPSTWRETTLDQINGWSLKKEFNL